METTRRWWRSGRNNWDPGGDDGDDDGMIWNQEGMMGTKSR